MKRYRPHILVACVVVLALLTGMRGILQDALTDLRFRAFPRQAGGDIVLVAIDSSSIRVHQHAANGQKKQSDPVAWVVRAAG